MRFFGDNPQSDEISPLRIIASRFLILLLGLFFASFAAAASAESALPQDSQLADDEGLADEEEASPDPMVGEMPESAAPDDADQADKYRGMEEILVTGRGGTENLQNVGASIAAFDADYIEALGAQTIADISRFTPNLEIRTVFAASNPTLFIRGVGLRDFNANSASAVAVYNDDIYMNSPAAQLGQLFDVQQVEVLRGPQGTLYGRNASAGAIRVVSRKPTGDTNGYTRLTYGKYNEAEVEGAMEMPLGETVSMRIAGRFRRRDGYTRNRCADPRYNRPDDSRNPNSFHNLVYNYCFNRSNTHQNSPYLNSPVPNLSLAPGGPIENIGSLNLCFYPSGSQTRVPCLPQFATNVGSPDPSRVPWYFNDDLIAGTPVAGATPFPRVDYCNIRGCSYPTPMPEGSEPLFFPAPYYSPNWKKGEVPQDIALWANAVDNWATRGLLRWRPSESVDWILNVHGGMNRGDSVQFQHIGATQTFAPAILNTHVYKDIDTPGYFDPDLLSGDSWVPGEIPARSPEGGDPFAGDYNRVAPELLNLYGASLTGKFDFNDDSLAFTTITGFEGNERRVQVNFDGNPFPVGFEPIFQNESWQITQEFILDWTDGDGLSIESGVNYLYENLQTRNEFPIDPLSNYATQVYEMTTHYASGYLWGAWSPTDEFAISAGGRWNYENKTMDLETTQWKRNYFGKFIEALDTATAYDQVERSGPSGDITFSYTPTDDRLIFLKYARGYKGPHINGGVVNADQKDQNFENLTTPVEPETVDSLEFGVKTAWFDNQLTLNGSVFYYDFQNIQIFQLTNAALGAPVQQLINAEDSDIYGAELELRAHPLYQRAPESIDGLEVFASFGWLHAEYTEFINEISQFTEQGFEVIIIEDNSGNRLVNAPEFAFAGYVSWPLEGSFGTLTPRFDWSYKSKVYFGAENLDELSQDPLWLMNVRIGYTTPNRSVELAFWVRNMTNSVYRVDAINQARSRHSLLYVMGEPRTYGVTLNARF